MKVKKAVSGGGPGGGGHPRTNHAQTDISGGNPQTSQIVTNVLFWSPSGTFRLVVCGVRAGGWTDRLSVRHTLIHHAAPFQKFNYSIQNHG